MAPYRELKNIPEENVKQVIAGFEAEGCRILAKDQQPDGDYTIKADCPDKTAASPGSPEAGAEENQ